MNPGHVAHHSGVYTREVGKSTASAPADHTHLDPGAVPSAYQGAPGVTLAGVVALHPSTKHVIFDHPDVAVPGRIGVVLALTITVSHNGDCDFPQVIGWRQRHGVLDDTPASHPAGLPWGDPLGSSWEGDRADMFRQHDWGVQFQQSNVCTPLGRQPLTELGVADDPGHFCQPVIFIEPQLSNLDPKAASSQLFRLYAVGSSQHPLGVDEGAPTDVFPFTVLYVVEPQADLPWEPAG